MEPQVIQGKAMEIVVRDEFVICRLTGKQLTFNEIVTVQSEMKDICSQYGNRDIIINAEHLSNVDSSGVGLLINLTTILNKQGKRLILAKPPAKVMRVVSLLKIADLLDISHSMEELVASYL
jgi:anti-anti-sigma factor